MAWLIQWDGGQIYAGNVTSSETHESVLAITRHPVETGSDITDSAQREVDTIAGEFVVSNQPIDDLMGYGGQNTVIQVKPNYYRAPIPQNPTGLLVAGVSALIDQFTQPGDGTFSMQVLSWANYFDAVADCNTIFTWLQDTRQLLKVTTPKASYENMLLERKTMSREARDGDGARFKLSFRPIRLVSTALVDAPVPTEPRGNAAKDKGKQGATKVPPLKESGLHVAVGAVTKSLQ